ncbi:MAG: response regulator transcription factor, partial [Gammaproteobacteria bacterium]|nr:response regulator transcription factor [Gammaproteobacteria bacterium]
ARCVGLATDGEQALTMIDEHAPDVVFLDVRMPQRDGLATAHALCERHDSPLIVFVTAFGEYAVEAFAEAAIDYLLKPIDAARLDRCVARLRERIASRNEASGDMLRSLEHLLARTGSRTAPLRYIRAGTGSTVRLIPVEDVLWFEAADKYVTVATSKGDRTIRMTLRELLVQLDPEIFWQVHRGTIVNTRHVLEANQDTTGQVLLVMTGRGERIQVSRQFAHLFRRM